MIKTITITNYLGEKMTMDLMSPEKSGFFIKSITGLGPAKADINSTEIATNDGSVYNSARLSERNIVMKVVFVGDPEETRLKSYKFFPIKKPLTFRIETTERIAECTGYVEKNEPNIFSKQEETDISILCPDPYFHDIKQINTVFYGTDPIFEFPFENNGLNNIHLQDYYNYLDLSKWELLTSDDTAYSITGDGINTPLIAEKIISDYSGLYYETTDTDVLESMNGKTLEFGSRVFNSTIDSYYHVVVAYKYGNGDWQWRMVHDTNTGSSNFQDDNQSGLSTIISFDPDKSLSVIQFCLVNWSHTESSSGVLTVEDVYIVDPNQEIPPERDHHKIEMGQINNLAENTVFYEGDAETGLILKLHAIGTVEDIRIYNVLTRESMIIDTDKLEALTGYPMIASDDITINTLRGKKSITLLREGVEINILNCLNKDADWFQLAKGDNLFAYTAATGAEMLQFKAISQTLYEGV